MTLQNDRRNPSMTSAQMRAAQMAIAKAPEVRQVLTEAMEGLELAAHVLDAWEATDEPGRHLLRRYLPKLGAALDALEAGPQETVPGSKP